MAKKFAKLHVLVVDDEPLIRWSLQETLEQLGHTVAEAGNREAALRTVSSAPEPFDVVLLDYRLPDSNDLDLLATIRQRLPATAVILMTAFGAPEVARGALQLGAFRVVAKPFEVDEIATLVVQASHGLRP
jgi:two-component system NtrC family response regulator